MIYKIDNSPKLGTPAIMGCFFRLQQFRHTNYFRTCCACTCLRDLWADIHSSLDLWSQNFKNPPALTLFQMARVGLTAIYRNRCAVTAEVGGIGKLSPPWQTLLPVHPECTGYTSSASAPSGRSGDTSTSTSISVCRWGVSSKPHQPTVRTWRFLSYAFLTKKFHWKMHGFTCC